MAKKTLEKVFISEADQYLFAQGTHYDIYKKLGAHVSEENGEKGVYFAVWAPNAKYVPAFPTTRHPSSSPTSTAPPATWTC